MPEPCAACLQPSEDGFHARCRREVFGSDRIPAIDVDLARLHTIGLAMVGRTSLSGVQRKLSLGLSTDRATLRVSLQGEQYILKPASDRFPALPQNERVSMRILEALGLSIPPLGLLPLADGSLAYIVRRFDRNAGHKRRQEDFCQLSLRPPKDKYRGSAELCAKIVRRFATEPGIELRRLFRRLVAGWLIGDGDLHLKNLSLLQGDDGRHRLSPAYDAVATRLYIPNDRLALPVRGRDDGLDGVTWRRFAVDVGLPARAAARVLGELSDRRAHALALLPHAGLPAALEAAYRALLEAGFEALLRGV